MGTSVFQPPPTYADPVTTDPKKKPGDPGYSRFNPIWLNWFLNLSSFVSSTTAKTANQLGALAIANNLSDVASVTVARTNLGLGSIATQASSAVTISGGSIDGTVLGGVTPAAGTFTNFSATGTMKFGTYSAGVIVQAGSITINDSGGTPRRLLVG